MKKLLALLLVFSFALVGCGSSDDKDDDAKKDDGAEIALITDAGDINDKSFNQSAWEAVEEFGKETDTSYKYYKPSSFDTAGYATEIENAVDNGAKVVVCPGFKFQDAMGEAQTKYPEVKFIMIDAYPTINEEAVDIEKNVYSVTYLEQQPGYLAGYAAVKDGHTKLGFMGGIAVPAVINFGYGYVQGALAAAEEMGVTIEVKYTYTGTFTESPDIKAQAASWYNDGTEVIFSCGGGICNSVFAAAEEAGKLTIGVDSDQKDASKTVVTSAVKGVRNSVYDALKDYKNDKFPSGGQVLDASGDYVGLSDDFSRFTTFTADDYKVIYDEVKAGKIEIKGNSDVNANGDPSSFATDTMKIDYFSSN
ncbi:MAG: BMP family protein [Coprobacillaceae bacterium]